MVRYTPCICGTKSPIWMAGFKLSTGCPVTQHYTVFQMYKTSSIDNSKIQSYNQEVMSFEHLALFLIWLNFMLYNLTFNMLYWITGFQNSWKTNNWLSNQHKPTLAYHCKYMKACLPLYQEVLIPWSQFGFTEKFKSNIYLLGAVPSKTYLLFSLYLQGGSSTK